MQRCKTDNFKPSVNVQHWILNLYILHLDKVNKTSIAVALRQLVPQYLDGISENNHFVTINDTVTTLKKSTMTDVFHLCRK